MGTLIIPKLNLCLFLYTFSDFVWGFYSDFANVASRRALALGKIQKSRFSFL